MMAPPLSLPPLTWQRSSSLPRPWHGKRMHILCAAHIVSREPTGSCASHPPASAPPLPPPCSWQLPPCSPAPCPAASGGG
jgi:hypothetical protein